MLHLWKGEKRWASINHQQKGSMEEECKCAEDVAVEMLLFRNTDYTYVDNVLEKSHTQWDLKRLGE